MVSLREMPILATMRPTLKWAPPGYGRQEKGATDWVVGCPFCVDGDAGGLLAGHLGGEPLQHALAAIADVFLIDEAVAFVGVDDELGLDALGAQGVPELEALGRGALAVTVADDDQGGGLDLVDEGESGALGVDGGIVIDGLAEEGEHPLVDGVFAVVALPVGDAGTGDGGLET